MKKLLIILICFPTFGLSQSSNIEECKFTYIIKLQKHSGLFSCPYLGPRMISELNEINVCNLSKDKKNQIVTFELDSFYMEKNIKEIFLNIIGIPEWSINSVIIEK